MDVKEDRPRRRFNLNYAVTPAILLGLEYNPAVNEVVPTLNWTLRPETKQMPMVMFGVSSDRIFSPEGTRSYFLTVAKAVPKTRLAPYAALNWSEWEERFTVPFGLVYAANPNLDLAMQHDGVNTHWLVTAKTARYNATLLLVKGKHLGISVGTRLSP